MIPCFEIKMLDGVPMIHKDGVPETGLMSWNRYPSKEDTAIFRDAGLTFYSFMGNLCLTPDGVPESDLDLDDGAPPRMHMVPENIDKTMEMLLSVNPDLKILPRIILNAPVWWKKQHPDEVMKQYNLVTRKYDDGLTASLFSESWKTLVAEGLRQVIEYFESKWGDRIIGYHTGYGHCGEHTYWWWDHAGEYSLPHRCAFRKWLCSKYGSIEALNKVWNSKYKDFAEIEPPDPERYNLQGARVPAILLPEKETDLIDFQEFASTAMAEFIGFEAKTVKKTLAELGRTKLFGVFYGYTNLVANSTQTTSGHCALAEVLDMPEIDFICAPLSYAARQNGGCVTPQMITGSITAHGKMFYSEDDTGTHVVQREHHGYIAPDRESSIHAERRNFLETWRAGGSQWWMDLYGCGWFLDDGLKEEFARLNAFAKKHLNDRASCAETAVFVSLKSNCYMRDNPVPLTGNLIEHQLFEICAMGASYDLFLEDDIPLLAEQGRLKQYKMCIFLNDLAPDENLRAAIKKHLQNSGRSILWFYMPGYIRNGKCGAENSEDLTGIRFANVKEGIMPMLTETRLGPYRTSYGLTRAVYPRLTANDPDAETLGWYLNGTTIVNQQNGDGSALVCKDMGNWRSIWSSSPGCPSSLLADFAKKAGVHIYSERGDQVFRAKDWFGLHAKFDGPLDVPFEKEYTFLNFFTGETQRGSVLHLSLKRGETVLWEFTE